MVMQGYIEHTVQARSACYGGNILIVRRVCISIALACSQRHKCQAKHFVELKPEQPRLATIALLNFLVLDPTANLTTNPKTLAKPCPTVSESLCRSSV